MGKKGVIDLLVTPFVFGLIVVMLWLGATFAGMVVEKVEDKGERFYDHQARGEVLDAPCAVDSRGVFYRSAIENGGDELECLNPHGTIILKFQMNGQEYRWAAERTGSGVEVRRASTDPQNPRMYAVLVYDQDAGTKTPAVLEVGTG